MLRESVDGTIASLTIFIIGIGLIIVVAILEVIERKKTEATTPKE